MNKKMFWPTHSLINLVQITDNIFHKEIFVEIIASLRAVLDELEIPYEFNENTLKPDCLNILVGGTCFLPGEFVGFARNFSYIVLQFEPLSLEVGILPVNNSYLELLYHAKCIWDYSKTNVHFLQQQGITRVIHVPLSYHPSLHNINHTEPKDIDVIFCGTLTPRRHKIIEDLRALGLRVETPFALYGEARNALIGRAKIQLNIHQHENLSILEEARLVHLVANGCFIISEISDHDPYLGGVVFCAYDEIVATCLKYLNESMHERARIGQIGLDELMNHPARVVIESALIQSQTYIKALQSGVSEYVPFNMNYYEYSRMDVLNLIPIEAVSILDIGCAAGRLGQMIKARQSCSVTGIELESLIANRASRVLDKVYSGNALDLLKSLPDAHFDAIVMADVMEHIFDTNALLRLVYAKLIPQGALILSIPNVRHQSIIMQLHTGDWCYQPSGNLDNTHVRFFTLQSLVRILTQHGFYMADSTPKCNRQ